MGKKDLNLSPLSKNEQGMLKGGFKAYSAHLIKPIKSSVTVSVSGTCGCKCEAEIGQMK